MVCDLISQPTPPFNTYEQFKERLLQLYEQGEKDMCRKYFATPPLGGRRPCPQRDVEGDTIKYIFLFRLPPSMQAHLGEDNTSTLRELAAIADALLDAEAAKEGNINVAVEESTVAAPGAAAPPSSR